MRRLLNAIAIGMVLATSVGAGALAETNNSSGEHPLDYCVRNGGELIQQGPDSPLTACCMEDGCFICDTHGNQCEFDRSYGMHGGNTVNPPIRAQNQSGLQGILRQ